jgi:hypothetical protein
MRIEQRLRHLMRTDGAAPRGALPCSPRGACPWSRTSRVVPRLYPEDMRRGTPGGARPINKHFMV